MSGQAAKTVIATMNRIDRATKRTLRDRERKERPAARARKPHTTAANAAKYGVRILADWVNEPEHTVILVLEADSAENASRFVLPFLNVGSIKITAGVTCEETAQRCLGG